MVSACSGILFIWRKKETVYVIGDLLGGIGRRNHCYWNYIMAVGEPREGGIGVDLHPNGHMAKIEFDGNSRKLI